MTGVVCGVGRASCVPGRKTAAGVTAVRACLVANRHVILRHEAGAAKAQQRGMERAVRSTFQAHLDGEKEGTMPALRLGRRRAARTCEPCARPPGSPRWGEGGHDARPTAGAKKGRAYVRAVRSTSGSPRWGEGGHDARPTADVLLVSGGHRAHLGGSNGECIAPCRAGIVPALMENNGRSVWCRACIAPAWAEATANVLLLVGRASCPP